MRELQDYYAEVLRKREAFLRRAWLASGMSLFEFVAKHKLIEIEPLRMVREGPSYLLREELQLVRTDR